MKVPVAVIKADGINCDNELSFAFKLAGGAPDIIHVNDLREKRKSLSNYKILAIPGGFSYGDDIVSGKILALELTSFLSDELKKFIDKPDTLVIGICNGFQVLVRTGLLPFRNIGQMDATLANNDSGHFECRWINLKIDEETKCIFLKNLSGMVVTYQVAHGEGKFYTDSNSLDLIENEHLVGLRYVNGNGEPTNKYPYNPNGSFNAIAGVTDPTGRILGLMPHPERFVMAEQYPNWHRKKVKPQGLPIFINMVSLVNGKL
jgi:phosphoribosylformylglycinamidine synthase